MDCQVKRLEDRLENLLETVDTMASSMAAMTAVNHAMNSSMEEMAKIILTMNFSMNATSTLGDFTIYNAHFMLKVVQIVPNQAEYLRFLNYFDIYIN